MPLSPRTVDRPTLARASAMFLLALIVLGTLASCGGDAPVPGDPLRIATSSLPGAVLGEAYRADVVAVGGLRPYSVRLEEGELPPGVSLQGGVLVGTPEELGRYAFTLAVSDANLASTFESYDLTVRDLPLPVLTLDLPETEVRGRTEVRARVEDARSLRALRVRVAWDEPAPSFGDDDAVTASRSDVALFWNVDGDELAVDVAFLGETFDGEGELFRIVVDAEEPRRLGADVEVELLYADRHAFSSTRAGARETGTTDDPGADDDQAEDDDQVEDEIEDEIEDEVMGEDEDEIETEDERRTP